MCKTLKLPVALLEIVFPLLERISFGINLLDALIVIFQFLGRCLEAGSQNCLALGIGVAGSVVGLKSRLICRWLLLR